MKLGLSEHFTYSKLFRFCFPSIVMMVFTSIYGVVDGLFISNFVGKAAFAAVNLIMPFIMMIGGIGFMIGTGGSALVAKTLGEQKPDLANRYFTMMVKLAVICGLILAVVGTILIKPISIWLGATEDMLGYCIVYGRIALICNTTFILQNVFQSFFVVAQKPKLGLMAMILAGVTNMALDALFIGVFRWGVAGAAFATALSECVGGFFGLIYFLRPNTSLLRLVRTKLELSPIRKACGNGASELMTNISTSIVSMLYNFQLLRFAGENGVAAYGVLMYVQFVFIAMFLGYTIGTNPIVSYNYGAANHKELNNMLKKGLMIMGVSGVAMMLLAQLLATPLATIFVGYDLELFEMTTHAFRIFSFAFILSGLNIFASAFFTALNNGVISATISFLRTLVFQMLSVLILPELLGMDGIWWAITVAEVCACIISAFFFLKNRKRYHYA